jgi:Ser/Thr protein kinase RdoA (MazF antagonist)
MSMSTSTSNSNNNTIENDINNETKMAPVDVQVVGAYCKHMPLEAGEVEMLLPLISMRLCTSVVMAAHSSNLVRP